MINKYQTVTSLLQEISQLRQELDEANGVINTMNYAEDDSLHLSDKTQEQIAILKYMPPIYRVLIEEINEGFAIISANGIISFCNKRFSDIAKIPSEKLIGLSIYSLVTLQDRLLTSACNGGFKAKCSLKTGTGFYTSIALSAKNVTIADDIITCLIVTDLTEQQRNERLVQIICNEATPVIIACDNRGRITQANPAAVTRLKKQLVGNYFDLVIPLFRTSDGTKLRLSQVIDSPHGIEAHYERQDGRKFILLINASRLDAEDEDNLAGCVVKLTDVTEKSLLTDQLARLERLNIIGEVAAGIGHEVRNPLTTIRGYLQMFTRKEKYIDDYEKLQIMIEELDRANSIITEFLSLAKNKSSGKKLGNLNNTIHELFPLLQADAFRLGHEIQVDVGDIDVTCYNDKEIRQLILNLVRNGLEAMNSAGVITIKTYSEADKIILAVQDTGTGISDKILNKLGTPFITTKEAGTGLGLSICYQIAARHDAKIEVTTSAEGTIFLVKFKAP